MPSLVIFPPKLTTRFMIRGGRSAFVLIAIILLGTFLFSASSANKYRDGRTDSFTRGRSIATEDGSPKRINQLLREGGVTGAPSLFSAALPQSPPPPETIETFAADCTTHQSAFVLGDTVCAKLSGGPLSVIPRKFSWVSPDNIVQQTTNVTTDPQTDTFTLPAVNPNIDYRGVWRVNSINAIRSSVRTSAFFTVSDPAAPAVNLAIYKSNDTDGSITAGSNVLFALWLTNYGPDTATNVTIGDDTPANTTFGSGDSGPSANCTFPAAGSTGTTTCTLASLPQGASTKITLVVNVNAGTPVGTTISNSATISDDLEERYSPDNTGTSNVTVVAGPTGATCTLQCPDNVTANANTTVDNQRGAYVTYDDPIASGDCGTVTSTPASGSFFPVGTTVVNVTSETGGGSCSFAVTVEDQGTNPPTISCPANQEAIADNNCEATVTLGTPTVTGDNVTVVGVRSDGKPMYNCDCFPNSPDQQNDSCNIFGGCTRKNPDLPFTTGVTSVIWTAISHDTPGPYQTPADEEAHRTGTASCTQTVTVEDVTPPTITPPPDQTASADANCLAAVPDFTTSTTVTDNCACSSSDTSENCQGRETIAVTQSPAPGTLVGLGPHDITLTANDGSSNNNGAGNTATAHMTFTVRDTTAPIINCPANITTTNDAGLCSAVVNVGTATATDNCDNSPTINGTRSDNQPLNAPYPVGTTTITWTATDHASPANQSSCAQTITVNDNEKPTISCPASFTLEPTCPSGAVGTYSTPVGMDNCPGAITTRTAGFASGSVFPIGITTVTYSVTDAHGNGPVSCSFTVTVKTVFQTIEDLKTSINNSSLSGPQKQGLISKLNAAEDALAQGHTSTACQKLADFINSVQNFIDHGDISAAVGQAWINTAAHVRNTLGCTNDPCT